MTIAKLFDAGNSQAVRLPKDMRFSGEEVYARKIGDAVMLIPKEKAWDLFLDGISSFTDDYFNAFDGRNEELSPERSNI